MDKAKLEARLQVIAEEAAELLEEQRTANERPLQERTSDHDEAYEANEERLDELTKERAKIVGQITRIERIEKLEKDEKNLVEGVSFNTNTKRDPFDLNSLRWNESHGELRARARSAIEEVDGYLSDDQREAVTKRLELVDDPRRIIPNLIIRTGAPAYRSAFSKMMAGRADLMDHDERQAVSSLDEWRTAMSLTTGNGGAAVPFTLDPTLILTGSGSSNPIRQIARNVSITTDAWNGLTSAGVTARWGAENTATSDDSPSDFANPNIPVYRGEAFIQGSIEISQDYQAIEADLGEMIAEAKDNLEATAHITGPGTTAPIGIVTALTGGSSVVTPVTPETFAVGDLYKLQAALGPKFRRNASWVAELSTINAMRGFGATYGSSFLTELVGDSPAQVLGKPLYEASAMPPFSAINTSATDTTNQILVFGDFSKYVVVDRVGLTLEFIPHLFNTSGATSLPTGTRGWFAYWRTGADSVADNAFRMLNIATQS